MATQVTALRRRQRQQGHQRGSQGLEEAGGRQSGCEYHAVLFADADIKETFGESIGKATQPRPCFHCCGDGDHVLVVFGQFLERFAEDL